MKMHGVTNIKKELDVADCSHVCLAERKRLLSASVHLRALTWMAVSEKAFIDTVLL
jgi:hypothetical protein